MRWLAGLAALVLIDTAAGPAAAIVGASREGGSLTASMVMVLSREGPAAGFCSGIVVAQSAVLTAAHCVPSGATLKVHYRDGGTPVLLDVAAVARHPGYRADAIRSRQRSIDLALVRLSAPLPAAFAPATLGAVNTATVGAGFRLAGFGLRHEGEAASSGTLRLADVAARAPLSGVLLWADDPSGGRRGACTGDSGGAVLAPDDSVVGVIAWSAGIGAAQCGALTQAVWIGPQRGWIDGVLGQWATH